MAKRLTKQKRYNRDPSKEFKDGVAHGMMKCNLGWQTYVLRSQRGLTVEQLAEKSGVSAAIINHIEAFHIGGVTTEHIAKIAHAFDCAVDISLAQQVEPPSAEQQANVPAFQEEMQTTVTKTTTSE